MCPTRLVRRRKGDHNHARRGRDDAFPPIVGIMQRRAMPGSGIGDMGGDGTETRGGNGFDLSIFVLPGCIFRNKIVSLA